MPRRPLMMAAVGKSGPGMYSINSGIVMSGLAIIAKHALITSVILCGGMLVAIPTAIPLEPLISKLGILVGKTAGICSVPS